MPVFHIFQGPFVDIASMIARPMGKFVTSFQGIQCIYLLDNSGQLYTVMKTTGGNQTHGHCVVTREEMGKGGATGVGEGGGCG